LAGCNQPSPTPLTPCQTARSYLADTIDGINIAIAVWPDKFTQADIDKIQAYVSTARVCIEGYCSDPNNIIDANCADMAIHNLLPYKHPVAIRETIK
jgi:hypothetical protein